MSKADITDTNFSKANLHGIIAPRATFSYASMQDCILIKANLFESSLDGANLSGAKLQEANLSRSYIENTIFGNAVFGATILGDMDFSCATLAETRVVGRNLVGSVTIDKTGKGIRKILAKIKECNSECLIDSNPASGIYNVLK